MANRLSCFQPIITFGAVVSARRQKTYNGLISSLFLIILMTSISFCLTLCTYCVVNNDTLSLKAHIVLILYMVLGLAMMLAFFKFKPVENPSEIPPAPGNPQPVLQAADPIPTLHFLEDKIKLLLRNNVSIIGMFLFFTMTLILDVFNIIAPATCQEAWKTCDSQVYSAVELELWFHVIRLVYIGMELVFCGHFHRQKISNRWLPKYGLAFIQSANISLWFYSLVRELHDLKGGKEESFAGRCAYSNDTAILNCLARNTTDYTQLDTINNLFRPFVIEFTLLAGECFGHLFFSGAFDNHGEQDGQNPDPTLPDLGDIAEPIADGERRPLIDHGTPAINNGLIAEQPTAGFGIEIFFCLVGSLCFGVLLCVLGIKSDSNTYTSFKIFYFTLELVLILIGYILAKPFLPDLKNPFAGIDFLLLLSSFGPLMIQVFSINALVSANGAMLMNVFADNSAFRVNLTSEMLNTTVIVLQVTIMFYADRVIPANKKSWQVICFRGILLFVAIQNAAYWIIDSFIVNTFLLQNNYYNSTWESVNSVLAPLVLFFRLNSALMFFRAFCNY